MSEISKRRLALACCAALAFAVAACDDDGGSNSRHQDNACGDAVCTDQQECIDNVCKDKTGDDPCAKCLPDQTCEDGVCKDKTGEDPCAKCTEGQKCVDKVCTDLCGGAICGSNYACVDEECLKLCGGVLCKDGQICDKSSQTCIDKPTDGDPCALCSDSEECVDGECKPLDPCANKTCPDNWRCDSSKNGACVEIDPCASVVCLAEQTCVAAHCIDNACLEGGVEKDCGEGQVCSKGACVDDGCEGKTCDDGWQCIKGICEETVCIGYFCEEGRSCRGGACVDNECLDMVCGEGKVCSKGDCIYTQCVGKDPCPTGKRCNFNGECEYTEVPKIIIDEPEDKTTDEDGKTLTLGLHLNNAPSSEVRISCEVLTESENKEVEVSCDEIVFNADNWQLEQSIIVTGVADYLRDGDQTYKIKVTTTSEEVDFEELTAESVELTNIDTTKPGFIISETSLMTYEDQEQPPATFTVQLTSIPKSNVSLSLSSSNEDEGIASPKKLTFTKDNWNVPQTVTVKGVDDQIRDGNTYYTVFFAQSESNDQEYQGRQPNSIKVTNIDNDKVGITMNLDSEGFELYEGQEQKITVKLNTEPQKDVKVTMSVDNKAEAQFDVSEITLNADNWHTGKEIQLIGVPDHIIDGDQPVKLTFLVTSEDEDYNFKPIEYSGIVKDVDIADILVSMGESSIVKEGSGEYLTMSISLASKPVKEVTVALSVTDDTELSLNKQTLKFSSDHWDVPQDVMVNAVDDDIVDDNIQSKVVMVLSSSDENYDGKRKEIEFTTVDNDVAGLVVVSTPASFPENSASTAMMTVALKAQPTKDVTVSVTSSDPTELAVTSASTLTFKASNWNEPQTVSVQVVDDNGADGTQTAYVMFVGTSEDANFDDIKAQSANFTILDNDSASVALAVDPSTIDQGVPTSMATVSLGAEPNTDVTVTLNADHPSIFAFEKTVTFTKENWQTPQMIKINVNFDNVNVASSVENVYAVASGDSIYSGVQSNKVALTLNKIPSEHTFAYTGKVQSVTLPAGKYKLEVWGAQGGDAKVKTGGKGGYATGIITLTQGKTFYVYVGEQGISSISGVSKSGAGGWNGGGNNITAPGSPWIVGTGGGATDISLFGSEGSSEWNHTEHLYSRFIIAGGGGAAQYREDSLYGGNGGAGGGNSGSSGDYISSGYTSGTGGTQGAGGNACSAGGNKGQFGLGGNYVGVDAGTCVSGGGGGGWYGGGSCYCGSAAGGSGYIYTSSTASSYPSGSGLNSSYYLSNAQTIGGNATMPAPKGGTEVGHTGNGYARITLQ